jgi:Uncharacterized protein conserved in bacteria
MELKNGTKTYHATSRKELRKWFEKNHQKEKSLWLIVYHKSSATPSVYYDEIVEECLCFGWIDSKPNKRDHESFYLYLAQRKPKSVWSKINRGRVEKLIEAGKMKPAGMKMVELAKATGTWTILEASEKRIIAPDLQKAFDRNKTAFKNFKAFSPSAQQIILEWVRQAKRPETRQKRIKETVSMAAKNIKANAYQPKTKS